MKCACACGCGQETKISPGIDRRKGYIKGQSKKFIHGHNSKGMNHPGWKGGITILKGGYIGVFMPDHLWAHKGVVPQHVLIVEKVIGKPFPQKARVHHVDHDGLNNKNSNLVACNDTGYHTILHRRERAFLTSGHANWLRCCICHRHDSPEKIKIYTNGTNGRQFVHSECKNKNKRERWAKRNG